MASLNEIDNRVKNMVREGIISQVYSERHSARVFFPDKENLVSAELPILTSAAFQNQNYHLPDVGERVVVLMVSNDDANGGYILGSLYTGENLPQVNNQNISSLKFSDDAEFSYKRGSEEDKKSLLKMKFADGAEFFYECGENKFEFNLKFSDGCRISYNNDAEFEITFKDKGTITHARGDLEIDIKGEINISARGDVNIRGANIHLN